MLCKDVGNIRKAQATAQPRIKNFRTIKNVILNSVMPTGNLRRSVFKIEIRGEGTTEIDNDAADTGTGGI